MKDHATGNVNVTSTLTDFETVLAGGADPAECWNIVAILWRWHRDPTLNEESRRRAGNLVRKFGKRYPPPTQRHPATTVC